MSFSINLLCFHKYMMVMYVICNIYINIDLTKQYHTNTESQTNILNLFLLNKEKTKSFHLAIMELYC